MRAKCEAAVYKRDTYRVSRNGRGSHFKMHYTQDRCSRYAKHDGLCQQHYDKKQGGSWVERVNYA